MSNSLVWQKSKRLPCETPAPGELCSPPECIVHEAFIVIFPVMGMKTVPPYLILSLKVVICAKADTVLYLSSLLNKFDKSFCWNFRGLIPMTFMIVRTKQ